MKKQRKSSTWDMEAVGMIAGIILIVCFNMIFVDVETASIFMTIVIGMGVIMNSAIAMLKFCWEKVVSGIFFSVLAVLLLVLFIVRLFFLRG